MRDVAIDPRLGHGQLALAVVPERERDAERDRRYVPGTGEEAVVEPEMRPEQRYLRQVLPPLGLQPRRRRRLRRAGGLVLRALGDGRPDRLLQAEGQVRRRHGVDGRGIDRTGLADAAAELKPGDTERRIPPELVGPRLRELEHELQRIALHRSPRHDPGAGDRQALHGPVYPVVGDPRELLVLQHVVVVRFHQQRRAEPLVDLARFRALELRLGAAEVGELAGVEQIVPRLDRGVDRVALVAPGADVEELGGVAGRVHGNAERRQHERGERGTPAPRRVVHAPERAHILGVEAGGPRDRLVEGDARHRRRRDARGGRLHHKEQSRDHSASSAGTAVRRARARPAARSRSPSKIT